MRRLRNSVAPLLLLLLSSAPAGADETLRYRWRLDGFVGALASIFVPSGGEGVLTFLPQPEGVVRGELLVTSSESAAGDYFRYGSEWQEASGWTIRAWSDLLWRDEKKSKEAAVEQPGVIDVVSAIQLLRRDPPSVPRRLEIWSDGGLYPVLVLPRGTEKRRLEGREVSTRQLEVRGLKVPDRKVWKGDLHLWIADDPAATPVEIQVQRKGVRVRLIFVDRGAGGSTPAAPEAPGGT